jgi:hypothetical protein
LVSGLVRIYGHIFYFLQTFACSEMGPSLRREEVSDYYWSLPLPKSDSTGSYFHHSFISRTHSHIITYSQNQSYITTDGQSASLCWCKAPIWDPRQIFLLIFLKLCLDSYGFVDVGRPLWRDVGSIVSIFCCALPAQSFSGLNPAGLMTIIYCLRFWDSLNLEGQVPVFISPRNMVTQLSYSLYSFSLHFVYTFCCPSALPILTSPVWRLLEYFHRSPCES